MTTTFLDKHPGWLHAAALIVPFGLCAALSPWRGSLDLTTSALILVLVVVAAGATGRRTVGALAAVAGVVGLDFFFTVPYFSLTMSDPAELEVAITLLLVGLAVSEITGWGRRQQARASRNAGYLAGLLSTADAVTHSTTPHRLLAIGERQIQTVLHVDRCRFDPTPHTNLPVLTARGIVRPDGHVLDVRRRGLPTDTRIALPVTTGATTHGHYLITASASVVRPTPQQVEVVLLLADQVAAALARPAALEPCAVQVRDRPPDVQSSQ